MGEMQTDSIQEGELEQTDGGVKKRGRMDAIFLPH